MRRGLRSRVVALGVAALAVAVIAVPAGSVTTLAAWNDREWVSGAVGTSSFECGTDTGYTTTANAAFLRGELLGQDLNDVVELAPLALSRDATAPAVVSPATAVDLGAADGDPRTDTFGRPLAIDALGGIAGLDLTGLQVGLPVGSTGAVNHFAQVVTTGTSRAASALVDDGGGLLVSEDTPPDRLPEPARLDLGRALPALAGVTDARLEIGAVGSSATLDWCERLESAEWGDGSVSGLTRDYGIASLALDVDSPLVGDVVKEVSAAVSLLDGTVTQLVGQNGLVSTTIRDSIVSSLLSGLGLGSLTGTVSITNLDLKAALGSLLVDPISDGVVTIDLATGTVHADLAHLLGDGVGGLNDLAPNSELVIDDEVVNALTARAGAVLDAWTSRVIGALDAAIRAATITVDLTTTVSLLSSSLPLVRLDIDLSTTLGRFLAGEVPFTIGTEVLGLVGTLDLILRPLGLSISRIVASLAGLATGLVSPVSSLLTSRLLTPLSTLGTDLAAASTPVVSALGSVLDALPTAVSLMVNVQPDQPGAPPGSVFVGPTGSTSGAYSVSALRIGLLDALSPSAGFAFLELATSTVGPNRAP